MAKPTTDPRPPERERRKGVSRRGLLAGGAATGAAAVPLLHELVPHAGVHAALGEGGSPDGAAPHGEASKAAHGGGNNGPSFRQGATVDHAANGFNPTEMLRDFDWGRTRRLASGRVLREWTLVATDKEIEVAPGVHYPAWVYNGRVPGPTLRAHEGDRLRIRLVNSSEHPHTIHFHGIHPAEMDGVPGIGAGLIETGESTTYEFDAEPFGLHLYHCHAGPLAEHIARGLYGAFIVDPKQGRSEADELMMMMNGFNTNFDAEGNQVYAVNTVGFHYVNEPIQVRRDDAVRIYLLNLLEFDPINSFHTHANFFNYFPTGTRLEPIEFTDTVMLGQAQRGVLEMCFRYPGHYMFHAHKTEFTELGWMGFFEVGGSAARRSAPAAFCDLPGGA
ncbi:MAG TPA: multicopper oxidase domain-containing protein [Solirubrobacterales bacterium]|jgi:FtsP/CotA-like multicopper oxidase with cupredoxin domain|nr:multicopper oxidase domain-containing protein [Solirubrobacterales bacterium]